MEKCLGLWPLWKMQHSTAIAIIAIAPALASTGVFAATSVAPESRGYGTRAESEPPRYVRRASETGYEALSGLDWLSLGADYRVRYENRHHDYRFGTASDDPFLLRTRLYLGIDRVLDPLRLAVELQDSRIVHTDTADSTRDVNKHDVLQAYAELYGRDWLGNGEPLRLQAGRLAFEYLDRRLISRNPWRNTTNAFQGARLIGGSHSGPWWVDVLAVQPVEIRTDEADRADKGRWFYGAIGQLSIGGNGWSQIAVLQPYALMLDEDSRASRPGGRELYTWGLRGFAVFQSGFDYDFDLAAQTGRNGALDHEAWAGTAELGYTFNARWNPRASASIGYASGDKDPSDDDSNRFNRLFGFARPWSASDYQVWENIVTPKAHIELKPSNSLQLEAGYGAFWLASERDSWSNAGRRDSSGNSGRFVGEELDARLRWRPDPHVELISGYAHFFPGRFADNTGPAPDSDFFYVEVTLQAFK